MSNKLIRTFLCGVAVITSASAAVPTNYKTTKVDGLTIAYREAGNPNSPKLVLLHGFPASSHQYRDLIPALATRFHVIAPDYPGFGNSDMPDPATYAYSFDKLSEVVEKFLKDRGFNHYGLFVQDYGGPVGFRIVTRHPEALDWLIIQNTNAYEVGFTKAWDGFRGALWKNRSPETEKPLAAFLEHDAIKGIYLFGAKNPALISPDNWESDSGFMQRPNARRVQLDLFYDYRKNVELYPKWQAFLKERQPKTIIFWGQDDVFFTPEGGEAYLKDLPKAEMHRLPSGHFAVEDSLNEIAEGMNRFYTDKVASAMGSGMAAGGTMGNAMGTGMAVDKTMAPAAGMATDKPVSTAMGMAADKAMGMGDGTAMGKDQVQNDGKVMPTSKGKGKKKGKSTTSSMR